MIAEQIAGWSTAKFKRFVAKTEPQPESPPAEAQPVRSEDPDMLSPSPAAFRRIAADNAVSRAEASPVVRRVAAEIVSKYGRGRGRG